MSVDTSSSSSSSSNDLPLVCYRYAMTGILDLTSADTLAQLDFLTEQGARAFDSNIHDRIRYVTIACNLNEFLYQHHPLIKDVSATWMFEIGRDRVSRCYPYAVIYWSNQLMTLVGEEVYDALFANASDRLSIGQIDQKKIEEIMMRIASICGIANYAIRFAEQRSTYARRDMKEELEELKLSVGRLDLVYGWLFVGLLYRQYQSKRSDEYITKAFQYALSCYKRCVILPNPTSSAIVKTILRDTNMLRDVLKGEWQQRKGNKATAVALWRRAVTKGYSPTETQERLREEVELTMGSGYGDVGANSLDDELEPVVSEMKTFCAKGFDPLQKENCQFKVATKKPLVGNKA